MSVVPSIVSITKARGELGNLAESVSGEKYVLLTRGGEPVVAMVDPKYLAKLQEDLARLYQKTYIDPNLLPFTREFSDSEISEWLEEDKL